MKRQVREHIVRIAENHEEKNEDFDEHAEEIISAQITEFIWEILLLNIPGSVIENIISAEISFHHMQKNNAFDGLSVISSYHKALDTLIESFITKGFRKYAHKQKQTTLRENDILEKSLHSVVNSGYILWVGRLFHVLKFIHQEEDLGEYGKCFKNYLAKYSYLEECLLGEDCYNILSVLVNSEILWKKRHVWKINYEETKQARSLLIWDFENKSCLLYKLIETQSIDF